MEHKISKELVKQVIRAKHITKLNCFNENITIYRDGTCIENQCYQDNVYKFAHKCKTWAMLEGYYIKTWFDEITCWYSIHKDGKKIKKGSIQGPDFQAMFDACEWVLKELKENN